MGSCLSLRAFVHAQTASTADTQYYYLLLWWYLVPLLLKRAAAHVTRKLLMESEVRSDLARCAGLLHQQDVHEQKLHVTAGPKPAQEQSMQRTDAFSLLDAAANAVMSEKQMGEGQSESCM